MASFQKFMLPDDVRLPMLILAPSPEEMPHSSLSYMLGLVRQNCGTDDSCFYVVDGALQAETLDHQLEQVTQSDQPVMVLGTAFAYMHWLEYCQDRNRTFRLPAGSRLMETGGFKGRSRTLSKHQLYQQLSVNLGIPRTQMVNEYGMTELSTQFYDETLVCGQPTDDKVLPPWARIMFVDPRTGHPCGSGEVGMMRILDLANIGSSICLATEDLGLAVDPNRFQVLGRASEAGARGCSLTMDNLAAIS